MNKMLATSFFAVLMVWQTHAREEFSGMRCGLSNGESDDCTKTECKLSGPTRRRNGRVGAKFCLGGEYKSIWYGTSTTEKQCSDAPTQGITGSMRSLYSSGVTLAAKSGLCDYRKDSNQSYKRTCVGQSDGSNFLTITFKGEGCLQSEFKSNKTDDNYQWNATAMKRVWYPCFCSTTEEFTAKPVSECHACDNSEVTCNSEDLCSHSYKNKCSRSGTTCGCASGNYVKPDVCIGGKLHRAFFTASTHSACKAFTAGAYKAFSSNSRRRGGATTCQQNKGTLWVDNTTSHLSEHHRSIYGRYEVAYKSEKDQDCTGVADGQMPKRSKFSDTACSTNVESVSIDWLEQDDCGCMSADEPVVSDCRSCGGAECSTEDSCTMSRASTCAWGAAVSGQCSCSTKVFRTEGRCYKGKYSSIYFNDATRSQCLNNEPSKFVYATPKNPDDDDSLKCRAESDLWRIDADCTNVADFGLPNRTFYFDSACTNKSTSEYDANRGSDSSNVCRCEPFLQCKANTKFEKYWCTGKSGTIIAQVFSDPFCKTATGVNRSLDSITDFVDMQGTCSAWPPKALQPSADSSLQLSCDAADVAPTHKSWGASTDPTFTCTGTAADTGPIEGCFCTDMLMYKAKAAESNSQVDGHLTLQVSDVDAAVASPKFKKVVKGSVAETLGVSSKNIVDFQLTKTARRLQEFETSARKLAAGSIKATYKIVVPKAMATAVKANMVNVKATDISSKVEAKVASAGLAFTATVTAKSEITVESVDALFTGAMGGTTVAPATTAEPGKASASGCHSWKSLSVMVASVVAGALAQ